MNKRLFRSTLNTICCRVIEPSPKPVDQFFNASTGESQYGKKDFDGLWNDANGLVTVESEIKGGEGLMLLASRFYAGWRIRWDGGQETGCYSCQSERQAAKNATAEV